MNQAFISFFFKIKYWNGVDISDNKCIENAKIVNQHCMNHYCKSWKDRNIKIHNKDTQKIKKNMIAKKRANKSFGRVYKLENMQHMNNQMQRRPQLSTFNNRDLQLLKLKEKQKRTKQTTFEIIFELEE